jgi:hypothetical protein
MAVGVISLAWRACELCNTDLHHTVMDLKKKTTESNLEEQPSMYLQIWMSDLQSKHQRGFTCICFLNDWLFC